MNTGNDNPNGRNSRRRYGVRELLLRSPLTIYRSRRRVGSRMSKDNRR